MAANDEFPRSVFLSSGLTAVGGQATVTFPATPGITWIVTDAKLVIYGNGAQGESVEILVVNGVPVDLATVIAAAAAGTSAEAAFSGQAPGQPGAAVTVGATGTLANCQQLATAIAYPV